MDTQISMLLTQRELAQRWGRSEATIGHAAAVGTGPRFIKVDGAVRYPMDEIQRYERACLYFDPAEVALQSIA
jgi:predicted DNA-binding transcriptional regulator AlpA